MTQRKRHSLTLLVAISGAPVLLAWLLVLNPTWLPSERANHGELVDPPRAVGALSLDVVQGAPVALGGYRDKWLLLLSAAACEADCRDLVLAMRQVRLAVGNERQRVERLLLLQERPPDDTLSVVSERFPAMSVAVLSERGKARWQAVGAATDGLYLIDPRGNLMMRYPMTTPPEHLLADLERLLKVSKHWRTNARN